MLIGVLSVAFCVGYCMGIIYLSYRMDANLQMNGGSLDTLVPTGVGIRDETILAWVTSCTVRGLKYLKDSLNIIHRGPPSPSR